MMAKRFRKLDPLARTRAASRSPARRRPTSASSAGDRRRARRSRRPQHLPRPRAEGRDLLSARARRRCRSSGSASWAAGHGADRRARAERDGPVRAARARRRRASRSSRSRRRPACRSRRRRSPTTSPTARQPGDDQRRLGGRRRQGRQELADELKLKANAFKSGPEADLVSRVRRLRRARGGLPRVRGARPRPRQDRDRVRDRLLEPLPRLRHDLRLPRRARPRAADRDGREAREPRART